VIEKAEPPVKAPGRRGAGYYYRVPEHAGRGRNKKAQGEMFEDSKGEYVDLALINKLRELVSTWRLANYVKSREIIILCDGSHALALVVIHKSRQAENAVIPAGMQESSAMDGNSPLCKCLIQATHQPADSPPCDWIPAVHAGMTGFNHLYITMSAPAQEPDIWGFSGMAWLRRGFGSAAPT
jgi:hypothetical protein